MSRTRLLLITALVAVPIITVLLAVSVGQEVPAPNPDLQLVVLPDKPTYALGERVQLRLVLRNTGTQDLRFSGLHWEYLTSDATEKAVTHRIAVVEDYTPFTLAPGQETELPGLGWGQDIVTIQDGREVQGKATPGTYIIRVELLSPLRATGLASIEIVEVT